jgi:predicted hotdog family 3-hydroxylacyl-ACP dehydratase
VSGSFPPIEQLLPHRGTMRLVDAATEFTPEAVVVRATVDPGAWYAEADGTMPAWIGLELMAQAIAVHVNLCARAAGEPPRPGVLLGARRYEAQVDRIAAGEPLQVTAQLVFRDESGFAAYDCTMLRLGHVLASSEIKVYEPASFEQLLASEGQT